MSRRLLARLLTTLVAVFALSGISLPSVTNASASDYLVLADFENGIDPRGSLATLADPTP